MKKLLAILIALGIVLSMAACSNKTQDKTNENNDKVTDNAPETDGNKDAEKETGNDNNEDKKDFADMTIDEMIENWDEDITIGITMYNYSNNWCSWQRNAMLNWFDQLENDHIKYYISDAQNDQAKQNDAVDTMIARGIDVLICFVVQSTGATPIAEKCEAAGIPCVFLNTKVDSTSLTDFERTWFIGANNEDKANMQMDMIFDLLSDPDKFADVDKNGDGKINMFYLQGPKNEDMDICYATVQQRIADSEYSDTLMLLEQQNSDNSTAKCKEITETWIGKYGSDMELVLAHTDAQVAGAIEALRSADLLSEDGGVYCLASNCLPDAQVYIKSGLQYGSVLTDPWWQGTNCLKMAIAAAMGNDITYGDLLYGFPEDVKFSEKNEKIVYLVLTPITADNVDIAEDVYTKATRTD
ncbi:MAG: substrate-binding domain-containing protein [Oscillospiraceae bacterium]